MNTLKPWVALLDEDEDDYIFWQHGFRSWAQHLDLHWFSSVTEFLSATSLGNDKPVALVMDGVIPNGEEMKWLSTLLLHPSCQQACLIMLSAEVTEAERAAYLRLGASDHLQKPMHLDELQLVVSTVSSHIARKVSLPPSEL
ncbi:response regulator [Spirosoma pollinicola]|nr:response regulator [Spirosoma pollinicola]